MKKIKLALIWKVLIAIVAGIGLGYCLPGGIVRIFATFSALFSQFISFMVPLIIVGLVTPAICRVGSNAGKLLILTVVLAYMSSLLAGIFSFEVSSNLFDNLLDGIPVSVASLGGDSVPPYFEVKIPPILDVISALVIAFLLGIILTASGRDHLKNVIYDFEEVVTEAIQKALIPLLPLYVFCIFLKLSFTGEAIELSKVFANIILVIFAMTLVWILAMFCIAGIISKKNPLKSLRTMLPAYITALSTSSSAATIPVTLAKAKECGVKGEVAGFTIPLCATVHMPGSVIKITACAVTLMLLNGQEVSFPLFLSFIATLAITAVAAPGVPGGVIMAALGVLSSILGFDGSQQAFMIALYVVMDSFGTAANVTCDGAIALIIDKTMHRSTPQAEQTA